jgi:hypothetical protein
LQILSVSGFDESINTIQADAPAAWFLEVRGAIQNLSAFRARRLIWSLGSNLHFEGDHEHCVLSVGLHDGIFFGGYRG